MVSRKRHRAFTCGVNNRGEDSGMAKLAWDQVEAIRLAYAAGGVTQQTLADTYHVNRSNIGHIVTNRGWRA
jgi:predicted DNA-binding protein (UPF0251 family)